MKKGIYIIPIILLLMVISIDLTAQCPMCRMAAESNLEHGGSMGIGLNKGILYMFMMPYLLVLTLGLIWYRNKKVFIDDETLGAGSSDDFELPE